MTDAAPSVEHKFVVVLNKNYELSRLTSGLGHVTTGLVASLHDNADRMNFMQYRSADGDAYDWISDWNFIVLRGKAGQLKTLRTSLRDAALPCVAYTDTMLDGGTDAQQAATRQRTSDELEVLALATFGERDIIDAFTKKFSLWH